MSYNIHAFKSSDSQGLEGQIKPLVLGTGLILYTIALDLLAPSLTLLVPASPTRIPAALWPMNQGSFQDCP